MELTKLVSKPQLIEVVLDEEHIVKKYGEAVSFYTWDKLKIEQIIGLSNGTEGSIENMVNAVTPLILDEAGNKIFDAEDDTTDKELLMAAITKVVQMQGK